MQNISGELIVSGLDSATSLIQAAKNLMNAVVLTVKASYVASTKYTRHQGAVTPGGPIVVWKMKAPEKKPLVRHEKPEEGYKMPVTAEDSSVTKNCASKCIITLHLPTLP